jgi:hypothetical protein
MEALCTVVQVGGEPLQSTGQRVLPSGDIGVGLP